MAITKDSQYGIIFNGSKATGIGEIINVGKFKNCIITVATTGTATCTIKCKAAAFDPEPTFSSAQSTTNRWDTVQMVRLTDSIPVDGDTGIVLTADVCRMYEINTNGISQFTLDITAYTQGTIVATYMLVNDI